MSSGVTIKHTSMKILINILVSTAAVLVAGYLVPGVVIASFGTAIVVAIILGIVNAVVKPLLVLLTLPITVLTLGLFLFVINALMVLLVARIVPGFAVNGFLAALLFSILVSLVGSFLHGLNR